MASSKEYLEYILEQLSDLETVSYRYMMGEYIIYYKGKIVGGIYDDRLLIKDVNSAKNFIDNVEYEKPYDKGKEMIFISEVDNKEFLTDLFNIIYDELPYPKAKKNKKN